LQWFFLEAASELTTLLSIGRFTRWTYLADGHRFGIALHTVHASRSALATQSSEAEMVQPKPLSAATSKNTNGMD